MKACLASGVAELAAICDNYAPVLEKAKETFSNNVRQPPACVRKAAFVFVPAIGPKSG